MHHFLAHRRRTVAQSTIPDDVVVTRSPIATGLDPFGTLTFAAVSSGRLFAASGLGPLLRWDGLSSQFVQSGVPAPPFPVVLGQSGVGTISGTYTAYVRFLDADGNVSSLSPISNTLVVNNVQAVLYGNVIGTSDARVVRKQILRNTSGQATVYYVDVDTTNVAGANFSSTNTDSQLAANEPVALFDELGQSLANRFGVARNDKPLVVHHLGRLFLAGEAPYSTGHIEITNNSNLVVGVGTRWTSSLVGRVLYPRASAGSAQIASVDAVNQSLTLTAVWTGNTAKFSEYTIRQPPAERNILYWSEAGLPDAWSATSGVEVGDVGEPITGIIPASSFLYIFQRRSAWRFTYQRDPARDAAVFRAFRRGILNQRVWAQQADRTFAMDEAGIYLFDNSEQVQDISAPIRDVFWSEDSPWRINWSSSQWFHCLHDQPKSIVRWFVCLGYNGLPRHALVFNYLLQQWWVEEYPWPIGASDVAYAGHPFPVVAASAFRLMSFNGTLDGVSAGTGSALRDRVAGATQTSLTTAGQFPSEVSKRATVAIVEGRGKGQMRVISAISTDRKLLTVTLPWLILPDATSVYQIGAVNYRWRSRRLRWNSDELSTPRRLELMFRPTRTAAVANVRMFQDFSQEAMPAEVTFPRTELDEGGFSYHRDDPDLACNLARPQGQAQLRLDSSRDQYLGRGDVFQLEVSGFSCQSSIKLYSLAIEGAS